MLDLTPIQADIDQDKKLRRRCESCNQANSRYLYIIKSVLYGIFHLCKACKTELDVEQSVGNNIEAIFVEKDLHTWACGEVLGR